MIKVLHVLYSLNRGGAESRTMDIFRRIDRSRFKFDFMLHTTEESAYQAEAVALGAEMFTVPRFRGYNYLGYRTAWRNFFSERGDYDVVHGHMVSTASVYLREAKLVGVPMRIAHARDSHRRNIIHDAMEARSVKYATDLFAVSKLAGVNTFGAEYWDRGMIRVIPNAITASDFAFDAAKREAVRDEFQIGDRVLIGHVGRYVRGKNHRGLLEIFKATLERTPNALLMTVGDGPLRAEIEEYGKRLGIGESLLTTGERRDINALLSGMDLFLFPSFTEGLPGVVLEAQASGLQCVVSDTVTTEVNISPLVYNLSLEDKPEVWADTIRGLLTKPPERSRGVGYFAGTGFDAADAAKIYEGIYGDLVSRKE
jgi:glycosyltransferase involved in cell wall biosynthesis